MEKNHKALCGSKRVCVDSFEPDKDDKDEIPYKVYVLNNKRSIKQYCYDTEMEFQYAFENVKRKI